MNFIKLFKIYCVCVGNNLKSRLAYRADFVLSMLITLISETLLPLFTLLIYSAGVSFPGWNFHEAMLIQSIFLLSLGVANMMFFNIIYVIHQSVREGNFDIILLKPISPLITGVTSSFDIDHITVILGGIGFMAFSLSNLPQVSFLGWFQFFFLFIMGLTILLAFALFMSGILFKWVGNSRIEEMFTSITQFGRYPISIYPKIVSGTISFVVPVAMIGFFPAQALLGRLSPFTLISVLLCGVFLFLAYAFFKRMIYSYASAGG